MGRINEVGVYMRQINIRRMKLVLIFIFMILILIIPFRSKNFKSFDKSNKIVINMEEEDDVLAIKTYGQDIDIYQGEKLLKNISVTDKSFFEYRVSGKWNFIDLKTKENKVLEIIGKDSKENDKLEIVKSDSKISIFYYILTKDIMWFFMMFLMVGLMLMVFITHNCVNKDEQFEKQFFYESFFCMFIIYCLIESETCQLFVKNERLLRIIYYELLMIMCIPILIYIREHIYEKKKKIVSCFLKIAFIYIFIDNIQNIYGRRNFDFSSIYSKVIIILTMIVLVIWDNKNVCKKSKILFSLFLSGYILSNVFYFLKMYSYREFIVKKGMIITVTSLLILKYFKMRRMVLVGKKVDEWECLAHRDILTGMFNRTAYEERLDDINDNRIRDIDIAIISCDINNLKKINDGFGHSEGDKYLINCVNAINDVISDNTKIYRIGGDEFVIIIEPYEKGQVLEYSQAFERILLRKTDKDPTKNISFAYGYAYYKPMSDKDIFETIKRADKNMYEKKEKMKELDKEKMA